jgi:hypothetical protein
LRKGKERQLGRSYVQRLVEEATSKLDELMIRSRWMTRDRECLHRKGGRTYHKKIKYVQNSVNGYHPEEPLKNAEVMYISPLPAVLPIYRFPRDGTRGQRGLHKKSSNTANDCHGDCDISERGESLWLSTAGRGSYRGLEYNEASGCEDSATETERKRSGYGIDG